MRCLACNRALSDFESTRKSTSGYYIDLCNHCFNSGVNELLNVEERQDLDETFEIDNEEDYNEL